jgi:tetratricopeptide (TPR) repeat protein
VSKRLFYLEKVTAAGSDDPMPWYALAMEYRALGRHDEALQTFTTLRTRKPDYVPMYLMCGQMLQGLGRDDDAREWMQAGIAAASASGDSHAKGELETALGALQAEG